MLREVARLQRTHAPPSMQTYIISGTESAADIQSFVWLAELSGIDLTRLMPVPLFESIESLRQSVETCAAIWSDTTYSRLLDSWGRRQEIMNV